MKKNLWSLLALALVISFTSFTVPKKKTRNNRKAVERYAVYKISPIGVTPQFRPENYIIADSQPGECEGDDSLCWIQFDDFNNNKVLDPSELSAFFSSYDSNLDYDLDNEIEIPGILEKKGF